MDNREYYRLLSLQRMLCVIGILSHIGWERVGKAKGRLFLRWAHKDLGFPRLYLVLDGRTQTVKCSPNPFLGTKVVNWASYAPLVLWTRVKSASV
jgi:hypothetical protein